MKNTRQLQDALPKGLRMITGVGKPTVVGVVVKEFKQTSKPKQKLSEFFAKSPLRGSGIHLERVRDFPHEVKL